MVRIAYFLILERLPTVLHGNVRRITASEKMLYVCYSCMVATIQWPE